MELIEEWGNFNEEKLYLVKRDNEDKKYIIVYPVYDTNYVFDGWRDQDGVGYPHYEDDEVLCSIDSIEFEAVKLYPHTEYGDLLTMKDWKSSVMTGEFIDYDGYGYYATEDKESHLVVRPSDLSKGRVDERWTHVMWFNGER